MKLKILDILKDGRVHHLNEMCSCINSPENSIRSRCNELVRLGDICRDAKTKGYYIPNKSANSSKSIYQVFETTYSIKSDTGRSIIARLSKLSRSHMRSHRFKLWIVQQIADNNTILRWYLLFCLCKYRAVTRYIRDLVQDEDDSFILEIILAYYGYDTYDWIIIFHSYLVIYKKYDGLGEIHISKMFKNLGIDNLFGICSWTGCSGRVAYSNLIGQKRCLEHSDIICESSYTYKCYVTNCYQAACHVSSRGYAYCDDHVKWYIYKDPDTVSISCYPVIIYHAAKMPTAAYIVLLLHTPDDQVNTLLHNNLTVYQSILPFLQYPVEDPDMFKINLLYYYDSTR